MKALEKKKEVASKFHSQILLASVSKALNYSGTTSPVTKIDRKKILALAPADLLLSHPGEEH